MANQLYNIGRERYLNGDQSWVNDPVAAVLINITGPGGYNFSQTHQQLSAIPPTARLSTSGDFTGKDATDGVADADDIQFPNVTSLVDAEGLVLFHRDAGDIEQSYLIGFWDVITGFPIVTPTNLNIDIVWDDGPDKIFRL